MRVWARRALPAAIALWAWVVCGCPPLPSRARWRALRLLVLGPGPREVLAWLDEMRRADAAYMAALWGPEDEWRAAGDRWQASLVPPWERAQW